MKRYFFALAAMLAALTAPAFAANPCALLTQAQVAKTLGMPVTPGVLTPNGSSAMCRWTNTAGTQAVVITTNPKNATTMAVMTTGAKVTGVGVPAYFQGGGLFFSKGNTIAGVFIARHGISAMKTGPMDSQLPALAKLVYNRL